MIKKIFFTFLLLLLLSVNSYSASSSGSGSSESAKTKTSYEKAVAYIKSAKKYEQKRKIKKEKK